ncbi:MAG: cysteine synthase A [Spirochaetes bacterium]|uniref:Cysteine synthase n=1 Tax=Candidatus Ornithospirochaeta stercoripullorum TaxID=2840899 RepID=A0A9D9H6N4_9SPIO|nr:cysteine synthase A [Candidatus Ornithospirochaeta stercoripullorum]
MRVFGSAEELIGRTPLIRLKRIEKATGVKAAIIAKFEAFNPAGSAKDRIAKAMIDDAEKRGLLKPSAVIIEPTSGNTGIGLSSIAVQRGYKAIIVMPETMSEERRRLMKAYGAELVLTDGKEGMKGAIRKAEQLQKEIAGSFIPGQFSNKANAEVHYRTTGPEIFEDTDGAVDIFIAGVGTGGTITGVGKYLKEKKSSIEVIAVEPSSSPVLSKGLAESHGIQGIGAGFVPEVLDRNILDRIITVSEEEAYESGRLLGKTEGILAGISSGAALYAAIETARKEENKGKMIVTLFPDSGDRYLSTKLYS